MAICFALTACGGRDLDQLLHDHAAALGGAEKLESVRTMRVDLHLSEPGLDADILYHAARPGKARVDLTMNGEVVFTEAFDGTGSWQKSHGAPAHDSSPDGTAALRRGAIGNLFALHELKALGYTLELLDPTLIDGTSYHTVQITAPDGHTNRSYLEPETLLLTRRRDVHSVHPDIDSTKLTIESVYSDFRSIDGILRPFRSVERNIQTNEVLATVEIRAIATNIDLDSSLFIKP